MKTPLASALLVALSTTAPAGDLLVSPAWLSENLNEPEIADIFKAAGVMPGDTVVSYCHTGQQATLVYHAAKRLGLKARVYDGSWDEWSRRTDLPVETTPIKN